MKSVKDVKEKVKEKNPTQGLVKLVKKDEFPTSLPSEESKKKQVMNQPSQEPTPNIPHPQRLMKGKLERKFSKFLDIFKKLYINIHFIDALEQTPSYVKFMKKILANKRKLREYETVALFEECNAIL